MILIHTIVATIEEVAILRRKIGCVQPVKTSTSHGELNATVVEKPKKETSKLTNPQDEIIIVHINDVNGLVKNVMGKTIGNVLLATTSISLSERNVTDVENRSPEVEEIIVHVVDVILTAVADSVAAGMEAEVSEETEVGVILTAVVEAETEDEVSEETEVVVILIAVVEAETEDEVSVEIEAGVILIAVVEVVMNDVIQDEVVRVVIVIMNVQMNATGKQEENVLAMHITEDHSQFVHAAIKAEMMMIEVNT